MLDIGCADGVLFERYASIGIHGIGVDPRLRTAEERKPGGVRLIRASVSEALPALGSFDAIVMLAVLEHIPSPEQANLAKRCVAWLNPGGRVMISVPSPRVDGILRWLIRFKLADGMSFEEHFGFSPNRVRPLFEKAGLALSVHETFQLGLNHLFVFEKPLQMGDKGLHE